MLVNFVSEPCFRFFIHSGTSGDCFGSAKAFHNRHWICEVSSLVFLNRFLQHFGTPIKALDILHFEVVKAEFFFTIYDDSWVWWRIDWAWHIWSLYLCLGPTRAADSLEKMGNQNYFLKLQPTSLEETKKMIWTLGDVSYNFHDASRIHLIKEKRLSRQEAPNSL